jgi:hypothetical protein
MQEGGKMGLMATTFILALIAILLGISYRIISVLIGQQHWKRKNIYTLKTRVPFMGHMAKMILRKEALVDVVQVH